MSYATLEYYRTTYLGDDPGDPTLQKYLDRATDDIDMYCNGPYTLTDYTTRQQELLKKANCAQAEFYAVNGETYNTGTAASETIGKYSHSGGDPAEGSGIISPRAKNYLTMSGLCAAGISVLGRRCGGDCYE